MIFDNGVAFIQGPILIQKVKNHIALKILELLGILLLQVYSWTLKKMEGPGSTGITNRNFLGHLGKYC